jgi:arylsulfatase A-like enzyme
MNRRALLLSAAATAALPVASFAKPTSAKPNILYVKFDDMDDMTRLSMMPHLHALAARGVRFVNSFVDMSSCGASRVSTLTGMAVRDHGLHGDAGSNGGYKTYEAAYGSKALPVALRAAGYRTSAIGRYMTGFEPTDPLPAGWDDAHILCGSSRPFAYRKFTLNDNGLVSTYPKADYLTYTLRDKALDFINGQTGDKPWFVYLCTSAPHGSGFQDVNDAPEPAPEDLDVDVGDQPHSANFNEADVSDKPHGTVGDLPLLDPAFTNTVWQMRRRAMLSVDRMLGDLVAALDASGQLANTYIIVDSDNGYSQGSHRFDDKIKIYEESQRVPLVIVGPTVLKTGQERTELVNNLDTTATIFDLTGATPGYPLAGNSLRRLLAGKPGAWRQDILFENGVTKGVRTAQGELYAETTTDDFGLEREYYDFARDPLELRNAIRNPAYADRIAHLQRRLTTLRGAG